MVCGGCAKRRGARQDDVTPDYKRIFGNYKYLNHRQLQARLERYKRDFCKDCQDRYECGFEKFVKCKHVDLKK